MIQFDQEKLMTYLLMKYTYRYTADGRIYYGPVKKMGHQT